jgi:hypothetical protein
MQPVKDEKMQPVSAPGWKIETRYSPGVLIGNWQEDRLRDEKRYYKHASTYSIDFKNYPGASPDVLIRRNAELNNSGLPSGVLFGRGTEPRQDLITWYDQDYNGRVREGHDKLPELRNWSSSSMSWVPEKSDYPIQGEPTNYGLQKKLQPRWSKDEKDLEQGMSARPNTTYRTSYLHWPRDLYLVNANRPTMSFPSLTPRLEASVGRSTSGKMENSKKQRWSAPAGGLSVQKQYCQTSNGSIQGQCSQTCRPKTTGCCAAAIVAL